MISTLRKISLYPLIRCHITTRSHKSIPITVVSGFLGAGKTTVLQNIISSKPKNQKFGIIVNDLASINIDSKLLNWKNDTVATLEIQNGCICCTLSTDLFQTIETLLSEKCDFDHIILECSGISEPRKIRELFRDAKDQGHFLSRLVELDTMITVVDAFVFQRLFGSDDNMLEHMNLMTNFNSQTSENSNVVLSDDQRFRKVTELLLEQVECADIVLLNKCDLIEGLGEAGSGAVLQVVTGLNATARVLSCTHGQIDNIQQLLGCQGGGGLATQGILDEHRKSFQRSSSCSHTHSHNTHTHDHRDHETHCEHKDHANDGQNFRRFEITSFAYQRRLPFHHQRISAFLKSLGNSVNSEMDNHSHNIEHQFLDKLPMTPFEESLSLGSTAPPSRMSSVLRSKGFLWVASASSVAHFLSHAGLFLEVVPLGRWWADVLGDSQQSSLSPVHEIAQMHTTSADWSGEYGDRRQELVFIGHLDADTQKHITTQLDNCLLTSEEMKNFNCK